MPKSNEELSDLSDSDAGSGSGSSRSNSPKPKKQKTEAKAEKKGKEKAKAGKNKGPTRGDNGEYMFEIAPMRFATVSEFRGKTFVGIREFYEKDGKKLPGKKGISLTKDQWERLKDNISDIDDCLAKF
ncbi:hypothetical protein EGW08_004039 [Elysia chlorotica]|uniref:Transcriptional coactivator p15 (PC4) C-terminal domain-containing protein n=1 Tax=Elysia chlorotica TaxID=188477 RepID=A0A3S0ZW74_ELYCH|nr:hypothetical protein EGW08_004039 [Elysia chlorotica]